MIYLILSLSVIAIIILEYFILTASFRKPLKEMAVKMSEILKTDDLYFIEIRGENLSPIAENFNHLVRKIKSQNEVIQSMKKSVGGKEVLEKSVEGIKNEMTQLAVVTEMGQKITSMLRTNEIFNNLQEILNSMMDAAVVEMAIADAKTGDLHFYSNLPANQNYQNIIAEWSYKNKSEVVLEDAVKDYARYVFEPVNTRDNRMAQSVLCFPLMRGEVCAGVVFIASFRRNAFNEYHIGMIRSLLSYTTISLENAMVYRELERVQEQLIHSEKMAYLGQLTAGIAHEIQNPLNFINNFADVSSEISIEIRDELLPEFVKSKSEAAFEELNTSLSELSETVTKISEHGKRADNIVKSMLAHARSESQEKGKVDLQKLIKENIRYAEENALSKYPKLTFNINTFFTPDVHEVFMNDREIGRVILNLLNNAIYAVREKQINTAGNYQPEISIHTAKTREGMAEITIMDNGIGISEQYVKKIFNPFFTTKPSGEGTGLGLSLSYDIIVKGHGGTMEVDTREGEYTSFILQLPIG
jgi:signal transduction histidine kinase